MSFLSASKLIFPIRQTGLIQQLSRFKGKKCCHGLKVAILGANGKVGQNVAMMLKQSSSIEEIALYDLKNIDGLCMELNYIDTNTKVCGYTGRKALNDTLKYANIVVILAGKARQKLMTRGDLFETNAKIVMDLAKSCATICPEAMVAVVTNPVNSLVPLVNEVYKKINKNCPGKNIFGVTTLDAIRANTFVAEMLAIKPENVISPVIGGHSTSTIVPLLSQTKPSSDLSTEEVVRLTKAVQEAGDEVVKTKGGSSATLSAAYAVTKFVISLANGLAGQSDVVESAYVPSNVIPDVPYLATQLELGPQGIQKNLGLPHMSEYECCLLETAIPFLKKDITLGEEYVNDNYCSKK